MNPLMEKYLIEEHRRDIERELANIRLQKEALKSRTTRQNWFTHTMQKFGQWLITCGEELVKRYEVTANPKTSSEQKYAH
jgi:hypothetical protein